MFFIQAIADNAERSSLYPLLVTNWPDIPPVTAVGASS
jgi:hypothetical protein